MVDDKMKETGRSERNPGTVIKKKSSSGCLIIKKKVTEDSVRGASHSSSRNLSKSSQKKKRRRDEQSEQNSHQAAYLEGGEKRVSNGLDVFEFDEYDGFDERRNRNDGSYRWKLYRPSGGQMESGNDIGTSDFHYSKKKSSMFAIDTTPGPEMEDDESDLPLSVLSNKYRSSSNKPIRLQGKNGVLKVMVNNNKQMGSNLRKNKLNVSSGHHRDASSMSKRKEKGGLKFLQSKLANSSSKESDTVMQLKSCKVEGIIISPPTENATRVKGNESKVKRGSGTEKQLLREKIKNMLFAAGWTIDYRPRRNRDYLDAVYINPAGTAYWSIIKAYDALQKEEEDKDNSKSKSKSKAGGSFTPLADEILGKLTRQTRKKMEREMKNKRKSEGSSRNSYTRKSSKKSRASDDDSSENSYEEIPKNDRVLADVGRKSRKTGSSDTLNGRKSRKIGRCTLLVRSSDKGPCSENDGLLTFSGKRTLLSWLIDSEVVHMSEHVQYMNPRKTRVMQKGWITKEGIHCGCCSKIVPVLKFELHAGSKLRQPFPNIYLQSGKSLMQCQIDAWNKQGELEQKGFYTVDVDGEDPNDDTCGLCGDGGDLICCDGCPSTFHQSCLDLQMLPEGDWHCPNCSCKYCEIDGGNCDKNEAPLFVCCFCQKKYHESCRPEKDLKPIESDHLNLLFCEQKCQKLHSQLQKLFGVKHELDSGFSWSLIHRSDILTDASSVELSRRVECNSMLAVAMSVMDECFLPFAERRSGINLIRNVVFNCGSNLGRLNYSGFFTAILERGDEVVCAASIRIHGTQLAEMPFIGTRHIYRRQGMCRRLLSAIESVLSSLEVEKLIIPAIAEHMHTWTDVFGFHPLEESHKQEMRCMNMLVFPGTDMLQKPLVNRIAKGNKTAAACVPLEDGCSAAVNKSELVSSSSSGNTGQFSQPDPSCKTGDVDSHSPQVPDVASHPTISSCEPQLPVSFEEESSEHDIMTQVPAADHVSSLVPCEPKLEVPGKESVSIHDPESAKESVSIHDPDVEESAKESVSIPDPDVEESAKESVSIPNPDVEESAKETVSIHDPDVEESGVQNGDMTNLHDPCSDDKVPTDTRSDLQVQVQLEKVEEVYVQNNITRVISPTIPCEDELHCCRTHDVKDMIEICGAKQDSCETEMNTKEDNNGL